MQAQRRGGKRGGGRAAQDASGAPAADKEVVNAKPKPPISTILQAEDISGSLDKLSKAFFGNVENWPKAVPKQTASSRKSKGAQPVERKGPARIAPRPPPPPSFLIAQAIPSTANFMTSRPMSFPAAAPFAVARAPPSVSNLLPLMSRSPPATVRGGVPVVRMAMPGAPYAATRGAARSSVARAAAPGIATARAPMAAFALARPMVPTAGFAIAATTAPLTTFAVTRAAAPATRLAIPRLTRATARARARASAQAAAQAAAMATAPAVTTRGRGRRGRGRGRHAAVPKGAATTAPPTLTRAAAPATMPVAVTCTAVPAVQVTAGLPVATAMPVTAATAATQPYTVLVLQASDGSHNRIMLVPSNSAKPNGSGVAPGATTQGISKNAAGKTSKKSRETDEEDADEEGGEQKRCRYFWEPSESVKATKALKRKLSTIWLKDFQVLEHAIGAVASHFPLVCPQRIKRTVCFPFAAPDKVTFLSWPVPKQRASEWLRASEVRRALRRMLDEQRPATWLWSRELITRKKIMLLCRKMGLTPLASADGLLGPASAGIMPFQPFQAGGRAPECRQCGRTFRSLEELVAHLQTHAANWPYKCSVCSRAFRSRGPLVVHERNHLTGEPFECDYCLAVFPTKENLVSHIGKHTGDMPYECRLCAMFFAKKVSLVRHMRTHTGEKPFKCPACSACFRVKAQLRAHSYIHTGEKPFKCPHCSSSFMLKTSLTTHIKSHTPAELAAAAAEIRRSSSPPVLREFECRMCSKQVKYRTGVDHYSRFHANRQPRLCRACLGGLFRKRNRGTHLHADKPHKCRHCPRAFAKMWGLVVHMRKHSKGKTFKCEHCTREFRQNSSFVIHVRTHGEGKPLKCWVCAQLFEAKDELVEHLNNHPTKLL